MEDLNDLWAEINEDGLQEFAFDPSIEYVSVLDELLEPAMERLIKVMRLNGWIALGFLVLTLLLVGYPFLASIMFFVTTTYTLYTFACYQAAQQIERNQLSLDHDTNSLIIEVAKRLTLFVRTIQVINFVALPLSVFLGMGLFAHFSGGGIGILIDNTEKFWFLIKAGLGSGLLVFLGYEWTANRFYRKEINRLRALAKELEEE